uniref:Uncharacterized protein n=1 Tax=Cyprinodon variegatus TaxID=28743 RepID=A0A3Q2D910_CYPVA
CLCYKLKHPSLFKGHYYSCYCDFVCRHYMVTIPAILEAGTETKFCASLMDPNETLTMTVSMRSDQNHSVLYERTSREEFLECIQFQVNFQERLYLHHIIKKQLFEI